MRVSRVSASDAPAGIHRDPAPSLKRLDPRDEAGKLIDSEHRGRYWWAAGAVKDRDVLDAGCGLGYGSEILASAGAASVVGVDIDEEAVDVAKARHPELADRFSCADLCHLSLPDNSFDVIICFETVHHVIDGERALGELHRVLRPDGLLLISSPSPDVHLSGNEHHVHEYRPTELSAVVEERFANVVSYRQHPWLASVIEPVPSLERQPGWSPRETRRTTELDPGCETYSILAASDTEVPFLADLVTLGSDFEVKWWAEQVANAERHLRDGLAEFERGTRQQIEEAAELAAREATDAAETRARGEIEAVERFSHEREQAAEAAFRRKLAAAEAREEEARIRLSETNAALLEANQSLARIPMLTHRFNELEHLRELVDILEGSRSWRYMAPARRLRHFFRLRR